MMSLSHKMKSYKSSLHFIIIIYILLLSSNNNKYLFIYEHYFILNLKIIK